MNIDKELLRIKRLEFGVTQKELAKLTGLSENTIYNYESGKTIPNKKNLRKIVNILNIDKKELTRDIPKSCLQGFKNYIDLNRESIADFIYKSVDLNNSDDLLDTFIDVFNEYFKNKDLGNSCIPIKSNFINTSSDTIQEKLSASQDSLLMYLNKLGGNRRNADFAVNLLNIFESIIGFRVLYLPSSDCVIFLGNNNAFKCSLEMFEYHINSFIVMCKELMSFSKQSVAADEVLSMLNKEFS